MSQPKKIRSTEHHFTRTALIWGSLIAIIIIALFFTAMSPLIAWRSPVYIAACFAGVLGLSLLLLQPLLIGGFLPGLPKHLSRRAHPRVGALLIICIIVHVGGLWLTSPPDVIDALTFSSPTPFSNWGVIAMWSLFATTGLALFRRRLKLRAQKLAHSTPIFCTGDCNWNHRACTSYRRNDGNNFKNHPMRSGFCGYDKTHLWL